MDAGQDPRGTETLEGEVIKGDLSPNHLYPPHIHLEVLWVLELFPALWETVSQWTG